MNKGEFVHRVQAKAGLSERAQAEKATTAVLHTLCGRLTRDEACDLEAQLPQGLDEMCHGSILSRLVARVKGPSRLDKDAFVKNVAKEGELADVSVAERVTSAVFHTLKEQITAGEAEDVAAQLPRNLKVMWLES